MFNNNNITSSDTFVGSNVELPKFDYRSFYRALVVSIIDPLKLGRIRVRIPALHYSTPDNQLPYATPACFTGLGNQVGQFFLPPVGSIVFVGFEYSSDNIPIYFGGIPTLPYEGKTQFSGHHVTGDQLKQIEIPDIPTEYKNNESIIYKSPSGAIIYTSDNKDLQKVNIIDAVGQKFQLIHGYVGTENSAEGTERKMAIIETDPENKMILTPGSITFMIEGSQYVFDKSKLDELFGR